MPSQKWWTLPAFRVTASVALALNHACGVASVPLTSDGAAGNVAGKASDSEDGRTSQAAWTTHRRRGKDGAAVSRHSMSGPQQRASHSAKASSTIIERGSGQPRPASPPSPPHGVLPINVVDFGAKGDNQTDDTEAFRAALEACSSSGGGTVAVPPGLFVLGGNLTVPPGVTLRGTYSAPPSHDLGDDASNPQSLLDGRCARAAKQHQSTKHA